MTIKALNITRKHKKSDFDIVSVNDFLCVPHETLDNIKVLFQPDISLYCVDSSSKRFIFVETTSQADLRNAPFYFIEQYQYATRLFTVSFAAFSNAIKLSNAPRAKLINLYSTGRCGSTLMSHVFNAVPKATCVSEPDIFTQLVQLYSTKAFSEEQLIQILSDIQTFFAIQASAQGDAYCVLKYRSYVISIAHLIEQSVVNGQNIFMHRDLLSWAKSFARAFGAKTDAELNIDLRQNGLGELIPPLYRRLQQTDKDFTLPEFLYTMWKTAIKDALQLQQQSDELIFLNYADIQHDFSKAIAQLLEHLSLPSIDIDQLNQISTTDSQAGTGASRDKQEIARTLTIEETMTLLSLNDSVYSNRLT